MSKGGTKVSGRFRGRIVEFARDDNGNPLYGWNPVTREYDILIVNRVVEDGIVIDNGATTQGLNYLAEAGFRGGTQVTTWYATLINNASYTTGVSSGDTAASHAGWVEWTGYNESVRQTWSPGAASGGSLVNGTVMTFTNNSGSTITVRGMALFSASAKGATTGTLWATAVESSGRTLSDGQAFQVIYENDFTPSA